MKFFMSSSSHWGTLVSSADRAGAAAMGFLSLVTKQTLVLEEDFFFPPFAIHLP